MRGVLSTYVRGRTQRMSRRQEPCMRRRECCLRHPAGTLPCAGDDAPYADCDAGLPHRATGEREVRRRSPERREGLALQSPSMYRAVRRSLFPQGADAWLKQSFRALAYPVIATQTIHPATTIASAPIRRIMEERRFRTSAPATRLTSAMRK